MSILKINFTILMFVIVSSYSNEVFENKKNVHPKVKKFLSFEVDSFIVNDLNYVEIVEQLNKISKFPINLEIGASEIPNVSLKIENTTIGKILEKLKTISDIELYYSKYGINITYENTSETLKDLMSTKIEIFEVNNINRNEAFRELMSIPKVSEFKYVIGNFGKIRTGRDDNNISFIRENNDVRSLLNAISYYQGHSFWYLQEGKSYSLFSFGYR